MYLFKYGFHILCVDSPASSERFSPHFCFYSSLGFFFGPIMARPFLSSKVKGNSSIEDENLQFSTPAPDDEGESSITTLYPVTAAIAVAISCGFLYFGIEECRSSPGLKRTETEASGVSKQNKEAYATTSLEQKAIKFCFVSAVTVLFCFYVGLHVGTMPFIVIFATRSELDLTQQEGTDIMSVYAGSFAVFRAVSMIVSKRITASSMLGVSVVLCMISVSIFLISGDNSLAGVYAGYVVLGAGLSSVDASAGLWIESVVGMNSGIMAAMLAFTSAVLTLLPIAIGNFIEAVPMSLFYIQSSLTAVMFVMMVVGKVLEWKMTRAVSKKEWKEEDEGVEEEAVEMC